jgi:hypothetical protein
LVFGVQPSSGILKTTDYWIMDKAKKLVILCYTPLSEPFRIYQGNCSSHYTRFDVSTAVKIYLESSIINKVVQILINIWIA